MWTLINKVKPSPSAGHRPLSFTVKGRSAVTQEIPAVDATVEPDEAPIASKAAPKTRKSRA